jgi:5-methyltetrahydropteroyltriglutamate--homocysteine methyltransferase
MTLQSPAVSTLGFPRIGARRELKIALESYWSHKTDDVTLRAEAARLRAEHWQLQRRLGVTCIPSNDFSLYDHVLDTSVMLGVIPDIYGWKSGPLPLETYFAMARGMGADACGPPAGGSTTAAQRCRRWK